MENYDTFSGCFKFFMVLIKLEGIVNWKDRHKMPTIGWRKTHGSTARIRDKNRSKLPNEVNDRV